MHESPDRHHDEEADKAPQHELLAALALFFIMSTLDEVLEDTPDEHEECECEDDRHCDVIDKSDDEIPCLIHGIHRCTLRERKNRESQSSTDVA